MEAQPLLVKFEPFGGHYQTVKNLFCLVLTEVQVLIVKLNKFEPSGGHFLNYLYYLFLVLMEAQSLVESGVNDNSDATLIVRPLAAKH